MSGVVKGIKKIFKKIKPILKVVATAAIVYYTVGLASAAFTAPAAGAGTAAASTTFAGATAAAGGGQAALHGSLPGVVGSTATAGAAATTAAASTVPAALSTTAPAAVVGATTAAAAPTGMMGWLQANPMATMMLGQGLAGAAQGYSADKTAERELKAREDERNERGLMGFDHLGKYQGVVGSQRNTGQAVREPVAPPAVTGIVNPQVAAVRNPQVQGVPIAREDLPQLNQQRQIG